MAEDLQYGESNKRKYEDSPPPVTRRATGFSSIPDSGAPPSYNNVPPPMNEIEAAKQRAQEIAARLLNDADPSKRLRTENGSGVGGYDSGDAGLGQKPSSFSSLSIPPQSASYGYPVPGPSKKIDIPNGRVGVIIGKGGETIKTLQAQSGAKIQVTRDMDADPNSTTRQVELMGTADQIAAAEKMIHDVLSEAEAGRPGVGSGRMSGQQSGADQFEMMIPNNKVGLVIGKGGETIKTMQQRTGARIQVIPLHLPPGDMSKERTLRIEGTTEQIEAAKLMVAEVTSENRRNQPMSGGYPQQGFQSRPPTNWAQPGQPMQQPGYGYVQPGAYPGPPQYNMNQPSYPGYPPQAATGGYNTGWDQSTATQNPQAPQGGYDYYNQQPPQQPPQQGAPTDASGYNYSQQPAYGQGYGQDGYGGYTQSGYADPQTATGYDQQQYNATYGTAPNPTPADSAYPTQTGESNQAPPPNGEPSPNTSYPTQATTAQPGYGPPPTQGGYGTQPVSGYGSYAPPQGQKLPPAGQPAATYAQPQQSPSAQGGGGYGYPTSQPGYGAQPYGGAPPGAQPGYGQPALYSSSYGSGYGAPPPAYSSDGSAGGNARGSYDATQPQTAPPAAAAGKVSPQS